MTTATAPSPQPGTRGRRRWLRHPARWIAAGLVLVLVLVAIVAATRPSYEATQIQSPVLGQQAPALTGSTLSGQHFSLATYRGRYVYVNFFASWCPSCQQEEASLIDFAFKQQQSTDGAALVSVVFNDSVTDARKFVSEWGIQWPVVPDEHGSIANHFGVTAPPMTFLINPSGRIVGSWAGPVTTSQLNAMLTGIRHHRGTAVSGG